MAKIIYSDLAKMELAEIWRYIAEDSPVNADKFIDLINEKCLMLAYSAPLRSPIPFH